MKASWASALLVLGQTVLSSATVSFLPASSTPTATGVSFIPANGTGSTSTSQGQATSPTPAAAAADADTQSTPASSSATPTQESSSVANPSGSVAPSLAEPGSTKRPEYVPHPDRVDATELRIGNTDFFNGTFDQPIDHYNLSMGTFTNRFWFNTKYYKGPGSPVFMYLPGEGDASLELGMLGEGGLPALYAKEFGGLVIVYEHRYFGESLPFDTLTAETLQYLDLPNSMLDITYFAQNVEIELGDDLGVLPNADKAPWVLIGGSYSGAVTAWINQKVPGVFWAHHASSAVVETLSDFWMYFVPVEEGLPNNCSADVRAVITYVDHILDNGNDKQIYNLKKYFGLEMLKYSDDFAQILSLPLRNWQTDTAAVFAFCDILEYGVDDDDNDGIAADYPGGHGLHTALRRYANYINTTYSQSCWEENGEACSTHGSSQKDLNTPNDFDDDRQWAWMCCHNPFGWWQVGPNRTDGTNIISHYVDANYYSRQCSDQFPETNGYTAGIVDGFTPEHLSQYTGGWDSDFKRVLFVNGEFDPWFHVTVSSDYRPGGPRNGTVDMPIFIIENGNHCPELVLNEFPHYKPIYREMLKIMGSWLDEFPKSS